MVQSFRPDTSIVLIVHPLGCVLHSAPSHHPDTQAVGPPTATHQAHTRPAQNPFNVIFMGVIRMSSVSVGLPRIIVGVLTVTDTSGCCTSAPAKDYGARILKVFGPSVCEDVLPNQVVSLLSSTGSKVYKEDLHAVGLS